MPSSVDEGDPSRSSAASVWPQDAEAATMLQTFRMKLMDLFPFVTVPPTMSAKQLRCERPFTWKAVMYKACMCYHGLDSQIILGEEMLKDLSEAMIIKPKKSLDLLQGLLLFLAW
jgi:hypothetical protein